MLGAAGSGTVLARRWAPGTARADVAAAVLLLAAALAQVLVFLPIAAPAVGAAIAVGSTVPVAWRRPYPVAAALIGSLVWLVPSNGFLLVGYVASLLLYYAVTAYDTDRYVAAAVVLLGVGIAIAVAAVRDLQAGEYAGGILAVVGPAAVGVVVRAQRERTAQFERLTVLLERERDARAQAAVADERARIARELHDLVSHTLSVVAVQADAAEAALAACPERAGAPLAAIRAATAEAMQEMRGLLGVLRGSDEDADRQPLPTIAALPTLVERARLAGVSARLVVRGRPVAVLPSVDLAVYRIAQEALTNAAKHAPGSAVEVCLQWLGDAIDLRVRDDGPGPRGEPSPDAHGLVGMRERVRVHGGSLQAGAAEGGGFDVHAVLPVRAE